jgi:3-hydroxyisobutyrate dehydrogenase-like beta-hydroxyacid dehydrogenase
MSLPTLAVLMPGDMGHAVGRVLREHGHRVLTCLAGRSERSCGLANSAGLEDAGDLKTLVQEADMILSILPPARALPQAQDVAKAINDTGVSAVYVDCNAISPTLTREVGAVIEAVGGSFIDGGIIGLAPGKASSTRFYVSGADTSPMEALDGKGIEVLPLEGGVGAASGMKMCYAALTKGKWTLQTAVLLTAERLGLSEALGKEFSFSQQAELEAMRRMVPRLPADSGRWVGEMEEIAATFADAGVPSGFHEGAAEIFRLLAKTPFASETRETIDVSRTMEQSIPVYAEQLPDKT